MIVVLYWSCPKTFSECLRLFGKTVRATPDGPPPRPLPLNKWTSWESANPTGGSPLFGNQRPQCRNGINFPWGARSIFWWFEGEASNPNRWGWLPYSRDPSPPQTACLTSECEHPAKNSHQLNMFQNTFLHLIGECQ